MSQTNEGTRGRGDYEGTRDLGTLRFVTEAESEEIVAQGTVRTLSC